MIWKPVLLNQSQGLWGFEIRAGILVGVDFFGIVSEVPIIGLGHVRVLGLWKPVFSYVVLSIQLGFWWS